MLVYCPLLSPSVMFFGRRKQGCGRSVCDRIVCALMGNHRGWYGHLAPPLSKLHDQWESTPQGTLLSVKLPSEAVSAVAIGCPDTWASQAGQLVPAPGVIGSSGPFGIETITL